MRNHSLLGNTVVQSHDRINIELTAERPPTRRLPEKRQAANPDGKKSQKQASVQALFRSICRDDIRPHTLKNSVNSPGCAEYYVNTNPAGTNALRRIFYELFRNSIRKADEMHFLVLTTKWNGPLAGS